MSETSPDGRAVAGAGDVAATTPSPAPPADAGLPVEELATPQRSWRLVLFPPGLRLDPTHLEPPIHVPREGFTSVAMLDERRKRLVVKRPRKRTFQLDDAALRALQEWLGPAVLLKVALRARLGAAVPIGALWMLTSVPLGCERALGDKPMPVDWFGLVMGIMLFVFGFAAQARPHRVFFLLDSIWFVGLAAQVTVRVVTRTDSPWWLIIAFWCLGLVLAGVQSFRRFAPSPPAPPG